MLKNISMKKRKALVGFWLMLGTAILFNGLAFGSASAQSSPPSENPDILDPVCGPDGISLTVPCDKGEVDPDDNSAQYWEDHCRDELGRYTDLSGFREVLFGDVYYFEADSEGPFYLEALASEYEFGPAESSEGIFVLARVWCLKGVQPSRGNVDTAEYILGDFEVYLSPQDQIPEAASVRNLRNEDDIPVSDATQTQLLMASGEGVQERIEKGELYRNPKSDFLRSGRTPQTVEEPIEIGFKFPATFIAKDRDPNSASGPPEDTPTLCEKFRGEGTEDAPGPITAGQITDLQCLIVYCIEETDNIFYFENPRASEFLAEHRPRSFPDWSNQIVGFPTWIEDRLFNRSQIDEAPAEIQEDYRQKRFRPSGAEKSDGEYFSDWSGLIEQCLTATESDNGTNVLGSTAPRVGYWIFWESLDQRDISLSDCGSRVTVSDLNLEPICESSFSTIENCDNGRRPDAPGAEKNKKFTVIIALCPGGVQYDMGENPDDSDRIWCDIAAIPPELSQSIPVARQGLNDEYASYIRDVCTYTYSRSSENEPGGVFRASSSRWEYYRCWMSDGSTCGTWWFRFESPITVTVREIQALETN